MISVNMAGIRIRTHSKASKIRYCSSAKRESGDFILKRWLHISSCSSQHYWMDTDLCYRQPEGGTSSGIHSTYM